MMNEYPSEAQMNIKRIVAREVLIIISVIFFYILSIILTALILRSCIPAPKLPIRQDPVMERVKQNIEAIEATRHSAISGEINVQPKINYYLESEGISHEDITNYKNRVTIYRRDLNRIKLKRQYVKSKIFYGCLLIYPLYLLIRLIIWAIKTLRNTTPGDKSK